MSTNHAIALVDGVAASPAVKAALALPEALQRGDHGESLRSLYLPDATSVEYPNAIAPTGGTSDLDAIMTRSTAGAALLAEQRFDMHEVLEIGDRIVLRYTWTGVVGAARGPFAAGQEIVSHIAAFATIREGRIARWHTYDCYEPF